MHHTYAYIPPDRRQVMAAGDNLPERATGAVLFADISGFTPLTDALVRHFGPRRGADELTRRLNEVYTAIIDPVERYAGSVIGFSGDAITCWFDNSHLATAHSAALRAVTAALELQQAMARLATVNIAAKITVSLAIKTAVATGTVRRFVVGDPAIQLIDVLAGELMDRMAAAEQLSNKGELVVDAATVAALSETVKIEEWRGAGFGVVRQLPTQPASLNQPPAALELAEEQVRAWVLPAVYERLSNQHGQFLAELRPATALYLKFQGLDFEHDEAAVANVQIFIKRVQRILARYEANLIQLTTGDKGSYFYAAFGAPIAHDDDAARAAAAALELRRLPDEMPFLTAVQLGISQGMMRVGPYGSLSRQTYGVLGEEAIVPARLMSRAEPGQILASQAIAEAAGELFRFQPLGLVQLKGKSEAQPIFALIERRLPGSEQWRERSVVPLVGRQAELQQMRAKLQEMRTGTGQIIRIEGTAGMGKSHLLATFLTEVEQQPIRIVTTTCQSTERDIAYLTARQLARQIFGFEADLSERDQIAQITATMRGLNPEWELRLPVLGDLLGLKIPDNPTTAAFDPRLRQEALTGLAIEMLQTAARRVPRVLALEDVQWMDEASQALLLALARVIGELPMLLVLVHRPIGAEEDAFLSAVAQLPQQTYLRLDELPAEGVLELVENRLQGKVAPLVAGLVQVQAEGNPFFSEELVDALREDGRLVQSDDGVWQVTPPVILALRAADCLMERDEELYLRPEAVLSNVDLGIPSSVQGIVLARFDRLTEAAKFTLKVASVIGQGFAGDLLARAHPEAPGEEVVQSQLATLVQRDFLRSEALAGRVEYRFRHNIMQEVTYNTLLENQQRELHQQVALALEALQPEANERLAFHYFQSDVGYQTLRGKAIHYLDLAARRSQREYANETALAYLDRALSLEVRGEWLMAKVRVLHILGRREQQRVTLEQLTKRETEVAFDTALLWGEYFEAISDYAAAQEHIEQALVQAQTGGNIEGEARCLARLGMIAWRQGSYEGAERSYQAALAAIEGLTGAEAVEAEVRYGLGLVYRQMGKYGQAQAAFEQDLRLNQLLGNRQGEAKTLSALGSLEDARRSYEVSSQYFERSLTLCKAIGDREGVGASLFNIAQSMINRGDHDQAETTLYKAIQMQQSVGNRWREVNCWNELGILNLMIGKLIESQYCFETGLNVSRSIGQDVSLQAYLLGNLGLVFLETNQFERAMEQLSQALQLTVSQGDVELQASCLTDMSQVSLRQRDFYKSIEYAQQAIFLNRSTGDEIASIPALVTLAYSELMLGNKVGAQTTANEALQILPSVKGEGLESPQRDYWLCYQIYRELDEAKKAKDCLTSAYGMLLQKADRINNPQLRATFLNNIAIHREIKEESEYLGIGQILG